MADDVFNGLTILLVDDERFTRATVASMLADLGRPTVLEAENGAGAVAILDERKVDFIISDFNMPVIHGLQLLRTVRAGKTKLNKPETPFALLTGYSEMKLVDLALALDTNAFLLKPVSKDGLRKRLTKMLKHGDAGGWLKARETYQGIDVDGVLDEIANPNARTKPQTLLPAGQPLIQSTKPDKPSVPTKGAKGDRKSAPRYRIESGPIEVRGIEEPYRPGSGPIEVRGVEDPYRPRSGPIEVRGGDTSGQPAQPNTGETPMGAEALGIEIANEQSQHVSKYLCPLDDLPKNAVLALDVFTSHGTLFLVAGTQLTPRLISMLYNLRELGHPVESIWLVYDKAAH